MIEKLFQLRIPDSDIDDLRRRLERTRFPDAVSGASWGLGSNLDYMRELTEYWRTCFDWRVQEERLNSFPQYKVTIDGVDLHYLLVPGKGANPKPLLVLHGWPGSVFEMLELVPRLNDPASFGGNPMDAFTLIVPSLPGFGLSFSPGQKRFGIPDIADVMAKLMTEVLGYQTFAAHGGDWGSFICSSLGIRHPEKLIGIHITLISVRYDQNLIENPTLEERQYSEDVAEWVKENGGYIAIQGTKPQTLAYGLNDSPAGLAAWIVEKFEGSTDRGGDFETRIDRDLMLANISLYWFTCTINASFWPYYERLHGPWPIPDGMTVDIPMGHALFPKEVRRPPRSIAETVYTDIRRWTSMSRGGHFSALEEPDALSKEVQLFFRSL
ncbi:MAG: multidrug MFS transporter [Rhodospirillaceae bacterium]|nr:multidrug MFS transporter [Rhodospirillaceae bacterium]